MNLKRRKLTSIATLIVFAVSNYTSVFAVGTDSQQKTTADNKYIQEFKEAYLEKQNTNPKDIPDYTLFINEDTSVTPSPVEPVDPAKPVEPVTGNIGSGTGTGDTGSEVVASSTKLLLTNSMYGENPTKDKLKNASAISPNVGFIIPKVGDSIYDRAYILFTPGEELTEIKVLVDSVEKAYKGEFKKGKTYLLEGIKILDTNKQVQILSLDGTKEYGNFAIWNSDNSVYVKDKIEVTENGTINEANKTISVKWLEGNNEKPSISSYQDLKVKFDNRDYIYDSKTLTIAENQKYEMKIPLKTSETDPVTNLKSGKYAGSIFSIDDLGIVTTERFALNYDDVNTTSIKANNITNNKKYIDEDKFSIEVGSNKTLAIDKVVNFNDSNSKNTAYLSLDKKIKDRNGKITTESLSEQIIIDNLSDTTHVANFIANIPAKTREVSNELTLQPGDYTLKVKVNGNYAWENSAEQSYDFTVISEYPYLESNKDFSDNLAYGGATDTIKVSVTSNYDNLVIDNSSNEVKFNLNVPSEDKLKKLSMIITGEDPKGNIIKYHIGNDTTGTGYDQNVGLGEKITLSKTGKYNVEIKEFETELGFKLNNLVTKYPIGSYKFTLDNEKPEASPKILDVNNNVMSDAFDNFIYTNTSLGIEVKDYGIDYDSCISNVKLEKKNDRNIFVPVTGANLIKVNEAGLYKLSKATSPSSNDGLEDGTYKLSFDLKDKVGNKTNVNVTNGTTESEFIIERKVISNTDANSNLQYAAGKDVYNKDGLHFYNKDIILKVTLPPVAGGYDKIVVNATTESIISRNYSTSLEPSNTRQSKEVESVSGKDIVKENGKYVANIKIPYSLGWTEAEFKELLEKTNNQFFMDYKVTYKKGKETITSDKIKVEYDATAPEIDTVSKNPIVQAGTEAGINVSTILYSGDGIGENDDVDGAVKLHVTNNNAVLPTKNSFNINFNEKNIKETTVKVTNNKGDADGDVILSDLGDVVLNQEDTYKVQVSVTDNSDQKYEHIYYVTVDFKSPTINLVKLDKSNKVGYIYDDIKGNRIIEKDTLQDKYFGIDDKSILGVLIEDPYAKDRTDGDFEYYLDKDNNEKIKLKEIKIYTHKDAQPKGVKLYYVDMTGITLADVNDKKHTIKVKSADTNGNPESSFEVNFNIDNTKPVVTPKFESLDAKNPVFYDEINSKLGVRSDFNIKLMLQGTTSGYEKIVYELTTKSGEITSTFKAEVKGAQIKDENGKIDYVKTDYEYVQSFYDLFKDYKIKELVEGNATEFNLKITAYKVSGIYGEKDSKIYYDNINPTAQITNTNDKKVIGNDELFTTNIGTTLAIGETSFGDNNPTIIGIGEENSTVNNNKIVLNNVYKLNKADLNSKLDNKSIDMSDVYKNYTTDFEKLKGLTFNKTTQTKSINEEYALVNNSVGQATYNFEEGIYVIEGSVYDYSGNETKINQKFRVDKSKAEIENVQILNRDDNNLVTNINDKFYTNTGFRVKYFVKQSISGTNKLEAIITSDNEILKALGTPKCEIVEHGVDCSGTSYGEHVIKYDISNILETDTPSNVAFQLSLKVTSKSGVASNEFNDSFLFDSKNNNDDLDFNVKTSKDDSYSKLTNGNISAQNNLMAIKYNDNPAIIYDALNLNELTKPNSTSLVSVTKKTLGDPAGTEIFGNSKESMNQISRLEKDSTSVGNIMLIGKDNNQFMFTTGRYNIKVKTIDACGNISTKTIEFTIDTETIGINENKDNIGVSVNKVNQSIQTTTTTLNGSQDIYYTANGSNVTFELSPMLSGFTTNSNVQVYKEGSPANNIFKNVKTGNLDGINENGEIVPFIEGAPEADKLRTFTLNFEDSKFNDETYIVKWTLESNNRKGEFKTYTAKIVFDDTAPNIAKFNIENKTGENKGIIFSNYGSKDSKLDAHKLAYTTSDTNFETNVITINGVNVDGIKEVGEVKNSYLSGDIGAETSFNIKIEVTDKVGRKSNSEINMIHDLKEPAVEMDSVGNYSSGNSNYYTNVNRAYNYNAKDTYLETENLSINNKTYAKGEAVVGDGDKEVIVTAKDYAGNISTKNFKFILDTVIPEIKQSGIIPEKHYNVDVKSNITYTDVNLNKDSYVATLNGERYENDKVISKDAEYTLQYEVKDYAGNIGQEKVKFVVDKIAPVIEITGIQEEMMNPGTLKPIIKVDDATATVTALLNGEEYIGSPIYGQGKYTLLVIAADKAGNVSKKAITFMLDSIVPTIVIENFQDGMTVEPGFKPNVRATKNSEVEMLLNGQPYDGKAIEEEGDYTLEIIAKDKSGNISRETFNFKVQKLALATSSDILTSKNYTMYIGGGILLALLCGAGTYVFIRSKQKNNNDEDDEE